MVLLNSNSHITAVFMLASSHPGLQAKILCPCPPCAVLYNKMHKSTTPSRGSMLMTKYSRHVNPTWTRGCMFSSLKSLQLHMFMKGEVPWIAVIKNMAFRDTYLYSPSDHDYAWCQIQHFHPIMVLPELLRNASQGLSLWWAILATGQLIISRLGILTPVGSNILSESIL